MAMRLAIIGFILVTFVGVGFYLRDSIAEILSVETLREISQMDIAVAPDQQQDTQEVVAPGPFRAKEDVPESFLTREGVISWTNVQRSLHDLPPLSKNARLNAAATAKVQDMFDLQYFEHVSPTGGGVADLALTAGYEYIIVGENLALGNFADDERLVEGWMGSPGHRANILREHYTEIGVAVARGDFEGQTVWLAAQEFGFPQSACLGINEAMKEKIDENDVILKSLKQQLSLKEGEFRDAHPRQQQAIAKEYNELVEEYNALAKETQFFVDSYNAQVDIYGACVEGIF